MQACTIFRRFMGFHFGMYPYLLLVSLWLEILSQKNWKKTVMMIGEEYRVNSIKYSAKPTNNMVEEFLLKLDVLFAVIHYFYAFSKAVFCGIVRTLKHLIFKQVKEHLNAMRATRGRQAVTTAALRLLAAGISWRLGDTRYFCLHFVRCALLLQRQQLTSNITSPAELPSTSVLLLPRDRHRFHFRLSFQQTAFCARCFKGVTGRHSRETPTIRCFRPPSDALYCKRTISTAQGTLCLALPS